MSLLITPGDLFGEGRSLGALGSAYNYLGQYQLGIDYYQKHLAIAREIGDRAGEGMVLGNFGNAYSALRQHQLAIDYLQQSLMIAREIGDRAGEGRALDSLKMVVRPRNRLPSAALSDRQVNKRSRR